MKKTLLKILVGIAFFLGIHNSVLAKQERALLSAAISELADLSPLQPVVERLRVYESALNKIAEISEKYSETDIALTLKSTGRFGDIDFRKVQSDYVRELGEYYNKVCQVTPSAICQAFTSLDESKDICTRGGSFSRLVDAHSNITNAMILFRDQVRSKPLYAHARDSYLRCSKKPIDADESSSREFFNYSLAKIFLQINDMSAARGIIEQLKDPFYKFILVVDLGVYGGKINNEYVVRLRQFISERMATDLPIANISKLVLLNASLSPGSDATVDEKLIDALKPSGSGRLVQGCNLGLTTEAFNQAANLLFNLNDAKTSSRIKINLFSKKAFFMSFDAGTLYWTDNCGSLNSIALAAIASLLYMDRSVEAKKFHRNFTTGNFANNKLRIIEEYFDLMPLGSLPRVPAVMAGPEARFAIFKRLVDSGQICEASKIFHSELRSGRYGVDANRYMTAKRAVAGKPVRCGDEDLELLLK